MQPYSGFGPAHSAQPDSRRAGGFLLHAASAIAMARLFILGVSGAGKTTMTRLATGYHPFDRRDFYVRPGAGYSAFGTP